MQRLCSPQREVGFLSATSVRRGGPGHLEVYFYFGNIEGRRVRADALLQANVKRLE